MSNTNTMKSSIKEKTDRSVELEGYRFDEKNHLHQIFKDEEWKNLTGVSEVVKDLTNFGVAAYYGSRRALMDLGYDPKGDRWNVEDFRLRAGLMLSMNNADLAKGLYDSYKAHATYSTQRAELGTDRHAEIDIWIKKCIAENGGKPLPSKSPVIQKFVKMTEKHNPRFIASEKHGYNDDLWLGGITDVIVETDQGVGIWDNKNRKAIYPKDILQMGGYLWIHPKYEFTHVMGIPLEGEETEAHYDVKGLKDAFLHQLEVYRFIKSITKQNY